MTDPRELLEAYAAAEAIDDDYKHPTYEKVAPEAIAALRAVLDLHPAGYPSREPEYGYHGERTESGQWVSVRNTEPDRPYYCETCDDPWPCRTVQVVTEALETAEL